MIVATGLASLAALAMAGGIAAHIVMLSGILAIAAISVALSYHYWRRDPARRSGRD